MKVILCIYYKKFHNIPLSIYVFNCVEIKHSYNMLLEFLLVVFPYMLNYKANKYFKSNKRNYKLQQEIFLVLTYVLCKVTKITT